MTLNYTRLDDNLIRRRGDRPLYARPPPPLYPLLPLSHLILASQSLIFSLLNPAPHYPIPSLLCSCRPLPYIFLPPYSRSQIPHTLPPIPPFLSPKGRLGPDIPKRGQRFRLHLDRLRLGSDRNDLARKQKTHQPC